MFLDDVDYLAFKHIHCIHLIWCTDCISTYAHCIIQDRKPRTQSSYPRSPRSSSRCSRRKCQKPTGGRWGTSGVPRSPSELLRERQAPEHFSPGLQWLIKCFTLIDALCSGVVCNRCCIIPYLPLLYYILVTLVSTVESMFSWLRPVEVGWFPITCEL